MIRIRYEYKSIYKIKNRPLEPIQWSNDDPKTIEYAVDIDLFQDKEFTKDELEKYIIQELTGLKILLTENDEHLRFSFFNRHWESDDCSLYIKVKLVYNETEKQRKLRKKLERFKQHDHMQLL